MYRPAFRPVVVATKRRRYRLTEIVTVGDTSDVYGGIVIDGDELNQEVIIKISADHADNDLMQNEAMILSHLRRNESERALQVVLPVFLESAKLKLDGAPVQANFFLKSLNPDTGQPYRFYTIAAIRQAYPDGITAGHAAWMWRRILTALTYVHAKQVVHGGVVPPNVLIQPEHHGAMLVGWSSAARTDPLYAGSCITAVSRAWESFYAPEILRRGTPSPSMDIFMAAACVVYLLGGDVRRRIVPDSVPHRMRALLLECLNIDGRRRRSDANALHEEFGVMLRQGRILGEPKFLKFHMPPNGSLE